MSEKKNKCSKGFIIWWVGFCILFLSLLIVGILVHINTPKKVIKQTLDGGSIFVTYADDFCGLGIQNLVPYTDNDGIKIDAADLYFDFSISTHLDEANSIDYEISIVPDKNSTIDAKDIKVYLEKQNSGTFTKVSSPKFIKLIDKESELGSPKGSMVLYKDTKDKSTSDNYRLRFWLSDQAVSSVQAINNFSVKVYVNGKAI